MFIRTKEMPSHPESAFTLQMEPPHLKATVSNKSEHGSDSTVGVWHQSPEVPILGCYVIATTRKTKKEKMSFLSPSTEC